MQSKTCVLPPALGLPCTCCRRKRFAKGSDNRCLSAAQVGIGACNHKDVCGQCTLRLRLCYRRHDCPL